MRNALKSGQDARAPTNTFFYINLRNPYFINFVLNSRNSSICEFQKTQL